MTKLGGATSSSSLSIPGTIATWDPSNIGSGMALDGTLLFATQSGGGTNGNYYTVRSINSHSTGKYFAEITVNAVNGGSPGFTSIGLANSSFSLNGGSPGITSNSVGTYGNDSQILINNSVVGSVGLYTAVNVVQIAFWADLQLIWFSVNGGNWNNTAAGNPTSGVGGVSVSAFNGPYYLIASMFQQGSNTGQLTANFGRSPPAFSVTPPAGYSYW